MTYDTLPAGRGMDALIAEKVCKKCGSTERMMLKSGYTQCKSCHRARNREYNKAHPNRRDWMKSEQGKMYRRGWFLSRRYGISMDEYVSLLEKQNSACAICGVNSGETLSVDHCHKANHVRGLLCNKCNVGLANFLDNPLLLESAARYLSRSRAALKAVNNE